MDEQFLDKNEGGFSDIAKATSINLNLDDYEDIFSDFDPTPYSERMLSEDFLYELKRAAVDREERGLALTLQLPADKRDPAHEHVILERLRTHFRRHHRRLKERRNSEMKKGGLMIVAGVLFMFLATYMVYEYKQTLWTSFVVVLLEPAGWFTLWEGLELILFRAKEVTPDLVFYRKLSSAKIVFASPLPITPVEPKN
jgi:hypothetical protein